MRVALTSKSRKQVQSTTILRCPDFPTEMIVDNDPNLTLVSIALTTMHILPTAQPNKPPMAATDTLPILFRACLPAGPRTASSSQGDATFITVIDHWRCAEQSTSTTNNRKGRRSHGGTPWSCTLLDKPTRNTIFV